MGSSGFEVDERDAAVVGFAGPPKSIFFYIYIYIYIYVCMLKLPPPLGPQCHGVPLGLLFKWPLGPLTVMKSNPNHGTSPLAGERASDRATERPGAPVPWGTPGAPF